MFAALQSGASEAIEIYTAFSAEASQSLAGAAGCAGS